MGTSRLIFYSVLYILKYNQVLLKMLKLVKQQEVKKYREPGMYIEVKTVVCTTLIENVVHLVD